LRWLSSQYFPGTQGVIFVVDSADREHISRAAEGLAHLFMEEHLCRSVFLVFAKKQDMPGAAQPAQVAEWLRLPKSRRCYVAPVCAHTGEGLIEGLDWLGAAIQAEFG
jgi:ADP-ribosylation factor protein 6